MPAYLEDAFSADYTYTDDEKNIYRFYPENIGNLKIVNGQIIASDPFFSDYISFISQFPVGQFPVELSILIFNDDERVAFSRIRFSDQKPVRWEMALAPDQDLSKLKANEIYGYPVDSGTGCFMDSSATAVYSSYVNENDANCDVIVKEMEKTYKHTRSWLLWEKEDINVALFSSGVGDGYYASFIGYDAKDSICRLVTDFGLLEWTE